MKKLMVLFAIFIFAGCSVISPMSYNVVPSPTNASTEILSDPPGARIEIGADYIGDTPLFVEISAPVSFYGTIINDHLLITATPKQAGLYMQVKDLGDHKIPRKIFFDMNMGPPKEKIDLNIK